MKASSVRRPWRRLPPTPCSGADAESSLARAMRPMRSLGADLAFLLVFLLTAPALAQETGEAPSFGEVAEILNTRCVMCHSGPAAPLGLQLDSLENLKIGSVDGPVAVPGDPEGSEIVRRIRGASLPRMPLTGPPFLDEQEIALIEAWIAGGMIEGSGDASEPAAAAPAEVPDAGQPVLFTAVEPIFLQRCVKCHSDAGPDGPPEGLRLGSLAEILAGGERVVVAPGSPGASELIRRVRGQSLPRMPFDGPPYLDEEQIQLLADWIEQGARDQEGRAAPLPVGGELRLGGTLTGQWSLDETPLIVTGETRIDDDPGPGSTVEVRGVVGEDGSVVATLIRER